MSDERVLRTIPDERVLRTFVYARHLIEGDRIYIAKMTTIVKDVDVGTTDTLIVVGNFKGQRQMLRYPNDQNVELST